MEDVKKALKYQHDARLKRALAPKNNHARAFIDNAWAKSLEEDADKLLTPDLPLKVGLGREIIPPASVEAYGAESVLTEPDMLNLAASRQRFDLLEKAGVLELGLEASEENGIELMAKMSAHLYAASYNLAMKNMGDALRCEDVDKRIKLVNAADKLTRTCTKIFETHKKMETNQAETLVPIKQPKKIRAKNYTA
jgi:hypothetical protein